MSLQDCRLAAKQVDTPRGLSLRWPMNVSQEGPQECGHGSVMGGRQTRRTMSLSMEMPKAKELAERSAGSPMMDFRSLWRQWHGWFLWLVPLDRAYSCVSMKTVCGISVPEGSMEVQQGRRFQHNCRTDQAGRPHEQGADSCDETIGGPKIRRSLMDRFKISS